MPRRREVPKREILPDPKFSNTEVAKFVNVIMTRGKKSVAERILYGALDSIIRRQDGVGDLPLHAQSGREWQAGGHRGAGHRRA